MLFPLLNNCLQYKRPQLRQGVLISYQAPIVVVCVQINSDSDEVYFSTSSRNTATSMAKSWGSLFHSFNAFSGYEFKIIHGCTWVMP
jgi:hypothetical protein